MQKYVWTMWWQKEENAPPLIKKCIASMREHIGAEVMVLDCENFDQYITLPPRIEKLFNEGKISFTHISDIIRFLILEKYGGLWLDSTVYVGRDVGEEFFLQDFYTIKSGTDNDYKNIAKNRWTSFVIGGNKGLSLFSKINELFLKYWELNDELICYFLIDFALNEVYDTDKDSRKLIDGVAPYVGSTFSMMQKIGSVADVIPQNSTAVFNKLNRKEMEKKQTFDRIKSLFRHILEFLSVGRWKRWGGKIAFLTLLYKVTRTSNLQLSLAIADCYNREMGGYWSFIGTQLKNPYEIEGSSYDN